MFVTPRDYSIPSGWQLDPTLGRDYFENEDLFRKEFQKLYELSGQMEMVYSSLTQAKVYLGNNKFQIALPRLYIPVIPEDYEMFDDHLLSKTIFPNFCQAVWPIGTIYEEKYGH